MNASSAKPFLPERIDPGSRFQQTMIRSVIAIGRAKGGGDPAELALREWPHDRAVQEFLTRGSVTPTTTTAANTGATALVDFLPLLGPLSASAAVFSRALKLNLGEAQALAIPSITVSGTGVSFIGQGAPFPIKQLSFDPDKTLGPKKLAFGVVLTRELYQYSGAESLIARVIAENLNLGIDGLLLDSVAADLVRPAGVLNGVAATAATAGGGNEAMVSDLSALAAAIAPVAGLQIVFIASPRQAVRIQLRRTSDLLSFPVLSSAALPDGVVVALAVNALVVIGDTTPRFEISKTGAVVMQDPAVAFSSVGTPNAVGAPIISLDQSDSIALRIVQDLNWLLRASGAVAWTQAVTW